MVNIDKVEEQNILWNFCSGAAIGVTSSLSLSILFKRVLTSKPVGWGELTTPIGLFLAAVSVGTFDAAWAWNDRNFVELYKADKEKNNLKLANIMKKPGSSVWTAPATITSDEKWWIHHTISPLASIPISALVSAFVGHLDPFSNYRGSPELVYAGALAGGLSAFFNIGIAYTLRKTVAAIVYVVSLVLQKAGVIDSKS